MKKTVFAALIATAAAFAAAGSPMPAWDHANDSGPIAGLTEVQYAAHIHTAKADDRIKFTVEPTGVRSDDGYQSLRRDAAR